MRLDYYQEGSRRRDGTGRGWVKVQRPEGRETYQSLVNKHFASISGDETVQFIMCEAKNGSLEGLDLALF